MASNLSVGSGVIVIFFSLAHLTASARFRARAHGPVSGRLSETTTWRRWPSCRGFPPPFGCRLSLLGHPIPAGELAPLAVGLPDPPEGAPDPDRVTAFRTVSCDRGGCPLYPEDGGAPYGQVVSLTGACRSSAASPCTPLQHPTLRGFASRGIDEGSSNSPSGLPLARGRPGGTGRPWAFPRASHPADQEPTTHVELVTGHGARARNYALNITSVDPPIV